MKTLVVPRAIVALLTTTTIVVAACGSQTTATPATSTSPAGPTETPIATSAKASPNVAEAIPAELRYQWIREPRRIPGVDGETNVSSMTIGAARFGYYADVTDAQPATILNSSAGLGPDGLVHLELLRSEAGCQAGDVGTYHLTPSVSRLALNAQAVDEPCGARKAAIVGDWTRMDCPNAPQWCLGQLDAGRHVSINYRPFVKAPDWHFKYGQFGYRVPGGWTNQEDGADGYVLHEQQGADGAGIFVFSDVLAHAQADGCPAKSAAGVGASAAAIFAWLRSLPGLAVARVDKTAKIGALTGYRLDLDIDQATAGTCPWTNGEPGIGLFVNAQTTEQQEGFDWGLFGEGRMRLFVLELAPGRTLLIDIEAQDDAAWDALLPRAMPIVESFEFRQ